MKKRIWQPLSYLLVAILASAVTFCIVERGSAPGSSKLDELESLIEQRFIAVEDVDMTQVEDAAADAMVSALGDRWSYYISAANYEAYREQMNNAYVGVGITISAAEQGFRVQAVSVGGPAEEAGMLPEDILTAVDDNPVAGMTTTELRALVRGEAGTQVKLTVSRGEESLDFTVTRREMQTVVASGKMLNDRVGLVTIENFDARCAEETIAAIEDLQKQGADRIIFDVRNNPGGYANELVKILDYLLPEGELFRTVDYKGREQVDTSDANYLDLPMAVLVNGDSYSAAEFFAAALREYEAAFVVGAQTCGKGYFQNTFRLNDGSAVGLSVGKYFTPKGVSLAGVGITPDFPVEVDEETAGKIQAGTLEPENDPQLQKALEEILKK